MSQDTTYYDFKKMPTTADKAVSYRISVKSGDEYTVKRYNKNWQVIMTGTYTSLNPEIRNGKFTYYLKGGKLSAEGNFKNNMRDSIWNEYDSIGNISSQYLFMNESITVIKEDKRSNKLFAIVDEMPQFKGDSTALTKFISDNVVYPEEAKKNKVSGRVYISFTVEKDGSVTEGKVLRGIGFGCDEAALNVIKKMPKWIPGKQNGRLVRVTYTMPVFFDI